MLDPLSVRRAALAAVLPDLRCPVCATSLDLGQDRVVCGRGHSFDLARQGYLNLNVGRAVPASADPAAMIAARQAFLASGHYAPIADALRASALRFAGDRAGLVVDLAGGTGYYLSHVLDALHHHRGLCLDLSSPALSRAARAHPRAAAVGTDVWQPLPLASRSAAAVMSVFGPRNAAEIQRILDPDGTLIVLTPTERHLSELIEPLAMLSVDKAKPERLAAALQGFEIMDSQPVSYRMTLRHPDVAALAGMGPSAYHTSAQALAARIAALPEPVEVTASVLVNAYRIPSGR